ncbi:MAG: hypothetical protein J0L92_11640 [Deltaproteobacteria bacterium]|nr:hypothetical protein [Deltaproteobacteria bacterium]
MADTRTNWAKTHDFTPSRDAESLRHPTTITELRQRVQAATDAGRHVHAVGSYWSFSDAPAGTDVSLGPARDEQTDPPTAQAADSLKLTEIAKGPTYSGKLGSALTAAVKQQHRTFVRLGGLVAVKEAIDALAEEDLALITMGSRSGQRVVGVCMTATHGGDFDLAPIADTVHAIHLLTHGGKDVWIERGSARITTDGGLKLLDGVAPGVRIEANDALFEAAIVSVGSLGIVASIVLEVRPMYGLSERVRWMKWDDVRAKLIDGSAFTDVAGLTDPTRPHPATGSASAPLRADGYRHLEIMINPYPDPQGVRWAFVATRVEHASWGATDFVRPDNKINEVALYLAVESGNAERYHEQLKELIGSTRADTPGAHRYLSVQDTKGRKSQPAYSSELCLSTKANAHVAAVDDMLSQIDRLRRDTPWEFSGFMSLRFTRASRGALAMQSSSDASERFCHVEVFALQEIFWATVKPKELEGRNEDYVDALFDASERHGGRTHWGQWAHPEHPHTIETFPRKQVFLDAKRALAGEGPIASFDNAFSVRAGLVPNPGWAFVGDGVLPTKSTRASYDTKALRERAPTAVSTGARVWIAAASGDGAPGLSRHDGTRSLAFQALELEDGRYLDGALVIAANHDGRLELFARADDGRIFHAWAKKSPDQNLGAFDEFDGNERFGTSPALARDGQGCLTMLAVDTNKRVLRRRQKNAGGTWHGWSTTSSPFVTGGCAALWSGGLVIAARDSFGKIVLGSQVSADQDAAFQWHTIGESADAEPTLVASPQGVVVVYFQASVLRAFAISVAAIRGASAPAITPFSSTDASPPRFVHAPGAVITANELVVAYPLADGKLARHRHALAGGGWGTEAVVDAKLVSAVSLVANGNVVTAIGKIAHDLVVRRVIV